MSDVRDINDDLLFEIAELETELERCRREIHTASLTLACAQRQAERVNEAAKRELWGG